MIKLGKLEKILNQTVEIDYVNIETHNYNNGNREKYKALTFSVSGNYGDEDVTFIFDLNCDFKKLLEIEDGKSIDFNEYIEDSETMIIINKIAHMDINYTAKICRWIKNKFEITIHFFLDEDITYAGVIEIELNLDEYL